MSSVTALGKVAVLMGGSSGEREVSLMSGQGVLQALQSVGVDAHAFDPAEQNVFDLKNMGFSRCFVALHGRGGEDGVMQGVLDHLGLPYTGSGVLASSVSMDKTMTKRIWQAEGLRTPAWREVYSVQEAEAAFDALGAMVVKPAREGSSIGVVKVFERSQCAKAYTAAAGHDAHVLCEQLIVGPELTCPVLGSGATARALPAIQIIAPEGNYDFENKYYKNDTQYLVPSGLPMQQEADIQTLVLKAYRSLGCSGWGRVDVMVDATTQQAYLLEINTAPGMTSHSLVPMSARAAGIEYAQLCLLLLEQTDTASTL
ncbi:MAG: D-alanine--D-alanine ligase [Brachymonas sp.]|jgi:D-alanine-D-alanine ligase